MSLKIDEGVKVLQDSGAKITSQRIAIMQALEGRTDHPTAEMLFAELKPLYPKLSIATVYSTVQLLADAMLVKTLSIDEKRSCFDPSTEPHGHFMCKKCRTIFDLPLDAYPSQSSSDHRNGVFAIDTTEVFYYGMCVKCARKET